MSFKWQPKIARFAQIYAFAVTAVLLSLPLAQAADTGYRLGLWGGYGPGALTNLEKQVRNEGPWGGGIWLDMILAPDKMLSLEHGRSIRPNPFSTGIGVTELVFRYFHWSPATMPLPKDKDVVETSWYRRSFSVYGGVGLGLAQAHVIREVEGLEPLDGSGLFLNPRVGAEVAWNHKVGLRFETSYGFTLRQLGIAEDAIGGSDIIQVMRFGAGLFWYF